MAKAHRLGDLSAKVYAVVQGLKNISSITTGDVHYYRGDPQVKISWGGKIIGIRVHACERVEGRREFIIHTPKPGPIARIIRKILTAEGISVPRR